MFWTIFYVKRFQRPLPISVEYKALLYIVFVDNR